MSIKTNFGTGSYTAQDFINEFAALFGDGVCTGLQVSAHSPANLSVDASAGSCIKKGLFLNSDAVVNVPIVSNTSGYNRIDIIVTDVSDNSIKAILGTPNSSPTAPLPTANQIVLAQVTVGNNVSVINAGNITDMKVSATQVGKVSYYACVTAPSGYLKANGAAVSRTTYANLFAAIGIVWGAGDGSTTFNLPDLRGLFPRGYDDGAGIDSGRVFGSIQQDELKLHTHGYTARNNATAWGADLALTRSSGSGGTNTDATVSSTGGTETRPKNAALLACIKY